MMLLTIKEVAGQLQLSASKVYTMVQRGELPSYQIGSCRRISQEDLNEFLKQHRVEPMKRPSSKHTHF